MKKLVSLIIGLLLITGCTPSGQPGIEGTSSESIHRSALPQMIKAEQAKNRKASLSLNTDTQKLKSNQTFWVNVELTLPENGTVDSVRSWLSFDASKLEVVGFHPDDSKNDFELSAPQEHDFDNEQGVVRIGKSLLRPQHTSPVLVERIQLKVKPVAALSSSTIDFFDFQEHAEAHTTATRVLGNTIYPILEKPVSPGLLLTLEP